MKEILISGYYGFNNSGDDALLQSITDDLKTEYEDLKITVFSKQPEQTRKMYKVNAVCRTNPFAVIWHMIKAEMLIFGGGTLIQDATSTKSLIYYLAIISLAKLFGVKVMIYANGIGPIVNEKNKKRTRNALSKVDVITLRDEKSLKTLHELKIDKENIEITADPVFLIKSSGKADGMKLLKKYGVPENKKLVGISVREWKRADRNFCEKIAEAVRELCERSELYPVFLPLQPKDNLICEEISEKCGIENTVIKEHLDISETLAVISNFHIVIGMRLHMLIYAASCAIPVVGISYDPKISGFMEYAKQERYVEVEDIDTEKLIWNVMEIDKNYDEIKAELESVAGDMKQKAARNGEILKKLLCKPEG